MVLIVIKEGSQNLEQGATLFGANLTKTNFQEAIFGFAYQM